MSTEGLSQEDLDLLRKYDTPTICNVIEIFEVRPRNAGYMDNRIKACFPEMPPRPPTVRTHPQVQETSTPALTSRSPLSRKCLVPRSSSFRTWTIPRLRQPSEK